MVDRQVCDMDGGDGTSYIQSWFGETLGTAVSWNLNPEYHVFAAGDGWVG